VAGRPVRSRAGLAPDDGRHATWLARAPV
jgi:hypothetical protein